MDATKAIALGVLGSSGAVSLSGTLFTEGGSRKPTPVKLLNPFSDFDLKCVGKDATKTNQKGYFFKVKEELIDEKNVNIKTKTEDSHEAPQFNLSSPSAASGNIEGCLRVTTNQFEDSPKAIVATIEMTVSKGNYGIILMNTITNVRKYGGPLSIYRAIFLQKNTKWEIKGGVEWSDAAFPGNISKAKKLLFKKGSINKKEADWENGTVPKDMYSLFWNNNNTKSTNIFQELTIKFDGADPSNPLDFWNGKPEPLQENSNISKASAFFEVKNKIWKKTKGDCCKDVKSAVKPWFDLFKNDKGNW